MNRFLQPSSIDEASISYWDISNEQIIFLLSPSSVNSLLQLDWNLTYDWKNPKLPVELWLLVVKMIFFVKVFCAASQCLLARNRGKGNFSKCESIWHPLTFILFFGSSNDTKSVITNAEERSERIVVFEYSYVHVMKFFSAVAKSYADVVTLIEGIFVAQSIGSKKKYLYD